MKKIILFILSILVFILLSCNSNNVSLIDDASSEEATLERLTQSDTTNNNTAEDDTIASEIINWDTISVDIDVYEDERK